MKRERIRGNTMRIAAVLLTLAMVMATVPFALAASGETYYTVTGTVVNAEDGTPVENATVTFDDGTYEFTATTGADGTYSLQALYGIYNVTVEADGYETYTERNVTVLIGGNNTLDVSLTKDGTEPEPDPDPEPEPSPDETYYTVTGTVVDAADGTPVENATVTFGDGTYEFTATTGVDGTYSLQALYGIYNVTVEADGYETYTERNVTVLIGGENKLDASLTRDPNAPNPDPSTPFTDVAEGAYYDEAVAYVYERGLMQGTSETTFGPDVTTTRAQVVTILYRLAGSPAVTGDNPFTDATAGWYADAVMWASQNSIVNGYSDTVFGPEDTITREQLAAILYRYADGAGYDVTANGDLSGFDDAGSVSSWSVSALTWANGAGLIQGSNNQVNPQGSAIRAQLAVILMRFVDNVAV